MKKKFLYKSFSLLLAVAMLFTTAPLSVFADGKDTAVETVTQELPVESTPAKKGTDAISNTQEPEVYELEYEKAYNGTAADGFAKGSGTADDPYVIETGAQLKYFADQVNGGNSFSGNHIRLDNNIDLRGCTWEPIGYSSTKPFCGNFDGGNHEIKNFKVSYDSSKVGYSETLYIGFFGYVGSILGASIRNLGIADYILEQIYSYDTVIGGLVAYAVDTNIINCYANGNISATFEDINPLDRGDVKKPEDLTPTRLDYYNPNGQGVILDLSNQSYFTGTLTIAQDVTAIRIIGKPNYAYNFNIVIESHNYFGLLIELQDVRMYSNSSNGTIYCDYNRTIYIKNSGTSTISNTGGAPAVNTPKNSIYILGSGTLSLNGSDGTNASEAGKSGTDGSVAVDVQTMIVGMSGTLNIAGGDGGDGLAGNNSTTQGATGWHRNWVWQDRAGTGGQGGTGGAGGAGGNGGDGMVGFLNVVSGTCNVTGGDGGDGGKGGKGGKGGTGGNNTAWGGGTGHGGKGGTGGTGGNAGHGGTNGQLTYASSGTASLTVSKGSNGTPGGGGDGGTGGSPGTANKMCTAGGQSGGTGDTGSSGVVNTPAYSEPTKGDYIDFNTNQTRLHSASLIIGGFIGYANRRTLLNRGTIIDQSACTVNDLSIKSGIVNTYSYNIVTCGNFAGLNEGNIYDVVTAAYSKGKLEKYPVNKWFGYQYGGFTESPASVLNNLTDTQGLEFDNGVNDEHILSDERTVLGKDGVVGNVTIPSYVYSGKFITAVTAIAAKAFKGNQSLRTVLVGENVKTIGEKAFMGSSVTSLSTGNTVTDIGDEAFAECRQLTGATLGDSVVTIGTNLFRGCSRLETIHIGKSLTSIPELKTGNYLFGLEKFSETESGSFSPNAGYALEKYEVADTNKRFASDSYGVLYEKMVIPFEAGSQSVEVEVIDVPRYASLSGYQLPAYVVRIRAYAFAYTEIQSISMAGVRDIGDKAFLSCSSLTSVQFQMPDPNRAEFVKILDEEIAIPEIAYSQSIGTQAFALCSNLKSVNLESPYIKVIGDYAFADCGDHIDTVTIGSEILSIGTGVFSSLGNGKTATGIGWFDVKAGNTHFCSVDGVLYEKLTSGSYALKSYPIFKRTSKDAKDLAESFSVPETIPVTKISKGAFQYAAALKYVTLENIQVIEDDAFANTNIVTVNLGASVVQLGTKSSNEGIYTVFADCGYLAAINVDKDNPVFTNLDADGVLYSKDMTALYKYPAQKRGAEYYLPETIRSIASMALQNAANLHRIVITSDLDSIGLEAFYNCTNLLAIYFKDTNAPIAVAENAFNTGNTTSETYIYYTADGYNAHPARWDAFVATYRKVYHIAQCKNIPDLEDLDSESYYAVVVVDKVGLPISGVTVKLTPNDGKNITDSDKTVEGIRIFTDNSDTAGGFVLDYSQSYTLLVVDETGTYFPFENTQLYLDESTRITYITLSSVPTVSGVRASYEISAEKKLEEILSKEALGTVVGDGHHVVDMNSETAKINTWLTDRVNLVVNCGMDPDVIINGITLVQNGNVIKRITDPATIKQISTEKEHGGKRIVDLLLSVETARFAKEQDVHAVVDFSDGNQVSTKLNLQIFELNFHNIDMGWLTNGFNLEFSAEAKEFLKPILDGKGLKLLPNLDLQFDIAIAPDSFKIQLGVKGEKSIWKNEHGNNDDLTLKQINDKFTNYCNLLNTIKSDRKPNFEDKASKGIEGSLSGFMEIKHNGLDENGKPDISYETGIIGAVMFNYGYGYTMPTPIAIPVRVEVDTSIGGEFIFKLVFDEEAGKYLADSLKFELKGSIVARAGIGFAMLSAGIYGKLETVVVFEIAPAPEVESWTLEGDLGLYLKYEGLFIKKTFTWSLLKALGLEAKMVIFEDGVWLPDFKKHATRSGDISLLQDLYDESTYTIATSSYDPKAMRSAGSAYNGIEPQTIQVGDLIYVVYHDDLAKYSEAEDKYYYTDYKDTYDTTKYDLYNYQKIVYQIYDTKTGTLSSPAVLEDNGYPDGSFELYSDGNKAVLVYTQMNATLDEDNVSDMAGYLGALEVKTAVLENGVFKSSADPRTNDTYYDMNLRVGVVNGQITAAWVRNEENTMFSTDNRNMSVWYSVYDGTTWGEPACLKNGLNTVTDIEISDRGIAYITDTNNDLATVGSAKETEGYNDRQITVLDMSGNVVLQTAEEAAYHDISFVDGELVYYVEGNLYTLDTNEAFFRENIPELKDQYTVLTDAQGNAKAILFVNSVAYDNASEENGSNVFAIFRNGDTWGAPVRLTDFGENVYVTSFDAVDQGNQVLISALLSEVSQNKDAAQETDAYASNYRFVTRLLDYPTGYAIGEVTCDPATVAPNVSTTLTVQISNQGCIALTEVPVTITRAGATVYTGTATKFYDAEGNELKNGLLSGHTGFTKVSFNPGSASGAAEYALTINGQTSKQQLWYSDFAVYAKQVMIGDTYHLVTRVTNDGHVSASYTLVAKIGDTEETAETIDEYTTDTLGYGESQYITIPLPFTPKGDGSELVFVSVLAEDEYQLANNVAKVNISTDEIDKELSTESLSVWISETEVLIDRDKTTDRTLRFSEGYTLVSATIDEASVAGLYTVSGDMLVLKEAAIAQRYPNGVHYLRLQFTDGSVDTDGKPVYKYATVKLTITQYFQVQWIVDGDVIAEETYEISTVPFLADPAKEKDTQYTYAFIGWDRNGDGKADELTAVTANTTYRALFSKTLNPYTVNWSVDGLLSSETYTYGTVPLFKGTPEKASSAQYHYVFTGWDQEITAVTGDITYTAVFEAILRKYTVTMITDGVSTSIEVEYGTLPQLPDAVKESDPQNHYTFTGWSPAVSPVYSDQTYTAQFTSSLRQYTVTWIVDGTKTDMICNYGAIPVFEGTPEKPANAQYAYQFAGWDQEITAVAGDVTYTARFDAIVRQYTVIFSAGGRDYAQSYAYGTIPEFLGDATKEPDETYRYVFTGWDKEITAVSGEVTYTAQYDAILRGTAKISNTSFKTAWVCEFTTTVKLENVQNMTGTTLCLYYDPQLVTRKAYICHNGTELLEEGDHYLIIRVRDLGADTARELLTVTFLTAPDAPVGESEFLMVSCEDKLTATLSKLKLYQMGDVNMDGCINTVDAAMVQRYVAGKLTLTAEQKVYGNVTGNDPQNPNAEDASAIQQYAIKKITGFGLLV